MIGITKDAIRVGDWISREEWIKTDGSAKRGSAKTGYKVISIEDGRIWVRAGLSDWSYGDESGWLLMHRAEAGGVEPPEENNYRRIIL